MDKVLLIIPESNKGKFITKGFSSAFRELNCFVYEKKIYDLNIDEINCISPKILFHFWTNSSQSDLLIDFYKKLTLNGTKFIHISEQKKDIPQEFYKQANHFCFSADSKLKKFKIENSIDKNDYKAKFNGYKYNITFSGNPALENRIIILCELIKNFGTINLFCRSYDFYKSIDEIIRLKLLDKYMLELYKSSYKGYSENQSEIANIYISSKINIDIRNKDKREISYRTLEILASGGFLITEEQEKIMCQFESGKEIETFSNIDELIDKINFYLKNLNIAQIIANNGRKNAVSNYKFSDRLKKILKVVYGKNINNR